MDITSCYTVKFKAQMTSRCPGGKCSADDFTGETKVSDALMRSTADECLSAYGMCCTLFLKDWDEIRLYPSQPEPGVRSRRRFCDILIHSTKDSVARYPEFDREHAYFPSYMRRAVIADAIGAVSSYVSNHENWEAEDPLKRGKEPMFGLPESYELTFYNQERDTSLLESGIIGIKLYDGKSWGWHYFRISGSDARFIARMCAERKMLSPVIERKGRRWQVRFSFSEKKTLTDKDSMDQRILAVDLGIIAPATWCVMESDGTVCARGTVRLAHDEDRLRRLMNRSRMYQQAGKKSHSIYRMTTAANRQLSIDTVRELMKVADRYNVDCIVFEHLDSKGKKHGRMAQRIHMWRSRDVQNRVELQAHRRGMRVSRICAWGTSKLAFDGSGSVKRGRKAGEGIPYNICVFSTGKQYSCDLSAAMNIGARYFLRAIKDAHKEIELPAVPQRTLSDLWRTADVLKSA